MKFSEKWLREFVDPPIGTEELAHRLTMIGHEVEAVLPLGQGLDGVIIGEVLDVKRHPDADRLSVCQVSTGQEGAVEVICGAPNVVAGMKSPFAPAGTTLPNGTKLRRSKIRGVFSNGMLCSAIEIGLGEESDGIVELPADAPIGAPLAAYLGLPDNSFDLDLTPNRGDCFSVLGIARDVAAMTNTALIPPSINPVKAPIEDQHPVELVYPEGCPRFAGQVVRGINQQARSPLWMTEKLRRSGLRPIHPVVDVTNYVMLELGQPLHAYDLGLIQGPIRPRLARKGEKLTLLDEREVDLLPNTMVISDDSGPIGMAGVMGGLSTMVTGDTRDVFFEGAFWPTEIMAGVARQYAMHTDASMRFERGVDPQGQARAVQRATELLVDIAGGQAGPMLDQVSKKYLPKKSTLTLRSSRLLQVLGAEIPAEKVTSILSGLGLQPVADDSGWKVTIPSYRFDIDVEDALVEEVARIFGYDEIPEATAIAETPLAMAPESIIDVELIANTLVARDYQEAITYSFIDKQLDTLLTGEVSELVLSNPISAEMSVMRTTIWPGILAAASANVSRQQDRVRLFEIGKTFHGSLQKPHEVLRVAGLVLGNAVDEQWGSRPQAVDFFDIKSDVSALLSTVGLHVKFIFQAAVHPALQPGQAAEIFRDGDVVGVIGKLHPRVAAKFGLEKDVLLFELDLQKTFLSTVPRAETVSKFPMIRRDIAVIVADKVSAAELSSAVAAAAPRLVRSVRIFDVYKGSGIEAGLKSVALGLILQETSRTLTDVDADAAMAAVLSKLQQDFAAVLRD
jgi:phenylalanyl-tRNA synthetase beta chain